MTRVDESNVLVVNIAHNPKIDDIPKIESSVEERHGTEVPEEIVFHQELHWPELPFPTSRAPNFQRFPSSTQTEILWCDSIGAKCCSCPSFQACKEA